MNSVHEYSLNSGAVIFIIMLLAMYLYAKYFHVKKEVIPPLQKPFPPQYVPPQVQYIQQPQYQQPPQGYYIPYQQPQQMEHVNPQYLPPHLQQHFQQAPFNTSQAIEVPQERQREIKSLPWIRR